VCADLVPEIIELDDWGYPIIRAGAIPASVLPHARRAISGCPTLALRLQALNARR
jgi:ferredoxin